MNPLNISAKIQYIRSIYGHETEDLRSIDAKIRLYDTPIHIAPEEGKLLQLLIKLAGAKKIVEVGTLAGYSTLWIAGAIPSNGMIYTIERDEKRSILAADSFKGYNNIKLLVGEASDKLQELASEGPFDAIFIDADKSGYVEYLDWAEKNIRSGGLIIADNTLLFGAVYSEKLPPQVKQSTLSVMHEFNQRLADQTKYCSMIIPTEEGMSVAIKLF